uniref:Uncharacterized protein n=1 Tax=Chelonoidis abingdonii TaxID=106734 RepID=A0A8C0GFA4_CHEAB
MSHRRGAREKAEAAPAQRHSHKRPRSQREPPAGSSGGCRALERHEQKRKKREEDETKPEDCIPDVPGNEHAREFLAHAPTKGLWMPLGKEVKVMQCKCKKHPNFIGPFSFINLLTLGKKILAIRDYLIDQAMRSHKKVRKIFKEQMMEKF